MCFELPILPLVWFILYTFTCVTNYPQFPWCGLFSALSHVFWITHTSSGVAYSLHLNMCFELPILPLVWFMLCTFTCVLNYPYFLWCVVFSTLEYVWGITHNSPDVWHILYTFTIVLNYPYFPWCGLFSALSHVFWITHTSSGVAYSLHLNMCDGLPIIPFDVVHCLHFHMCFELPTIPLVWFILCTFTCVLNYLTSHGLHVLSTLSHVFWITHRNPGVVYSLHFHMCAELPIIPLDWCILYISQCVTNVVYSLHFHMCFELPILPLVWFGLFSTRFHVFWITHTCTSPGVVYSLHVFMCFELPIHVLPLVWFILYTLTSVLNYPEFPWFLMYSLHFHKCFELPILPLVWFILCTFTCVLNYP